MIGAFPDLYPDELLCSGLARYEMRMAYRSRLALLEDLFGRLKTHTAFDLPSQLGYLAAALPPGHSCTLDALVDDHTLFPFYAAFMTNSQAAAIRQAMTGTDATYVGKLIGLHNGGPRLPRFFRYCPCCVQDDRAAWDECYWHRLHQSPGVEVCPQHRVWLEITTIPLHTIPGPQAFPNAEAAVQPAPPRPLDLTDGLQNRLLQLAQDAQWLLDHPGFTLEHFLLRERTLVQLSERSLISPTGGRLRSRRLIQAMLDTLSPDLLQYLHCELDVERTEGSWLSRLLKGDRVVPLPLYALLVMQFLSCTPEMFLKQPAVHKPFGDGPWPCLNAVCPHYRQAHIQHCHVEYAGTHDGRPRGTFACECGFTYARLGPDQSPEDRFRIGQIIAVGPLWDARFRELWNDPTVNTRAMRRLLGMSWVALKHYATRQNMRFPPPGLRCTKVTKQEPVSIRQAPSRDDDPTLYRQTWLTTHPSAAENTPTAQQARLYAYAWLRRHDRAWLEQHPGEKPRRGRGFMPVDWEQRDRDLTQALEEAAQRLRSGPELPYRLSAKVLLTEAQRHDFRRDNAQRLPLATATLKRLVETYEAFAIRRLWQVARQFRREGIVPSRTRLLRQAHVDAKWHQDNLKVQPAIEAARVWLREGTEVHNQGRLD